MGNTNLKSKKGNAVLDGITVMIVLLVFVVAIFVGNLMLNSINTDIQSDSTLSTETKQVVSDKQKSYADLFDALFLLVFILIWAAVLVASFMIDTHPIFFAFTVIIMIFVFILAAYLGNVYEDFSTDPEISGIASAYPMTGLIMNNLLTVIIVVGFSITIVLYSKTRRMT